MTTQTAYYDVLIVGQWPAAFAAALYAARCQMKAVIIGETFGGETATGGMIENYPGSPDIDGFELMMKFREQVEKYEVPVIDDNVVTVGRAGHRFEAKDRPGRRLRGLHGHSGRGQGAQETGPGARGRGDWPRSILLLDL